MNQLMPDLFNRRYADLVELGRSRLPGIAPGWTDFNAHDPGIMLMELLAWVAEAQMYSLARMRTDERAAYAALLGVRGGGNRAASGILWSDPLDPAAPVRTYSGSVVLSPDNSVHMVGDDTLQYRPTYNTLWIPGSIVRLRYLGKGGTRELTSVNDRGGAEFLALGEEAGPGDVLSMDFQTRSPDGIFSLPRSDAADAYWTIGIRAAPPAVGSSGAAVPATAAPPQSPLAATLTDGRTSYPVPIIADTTRGLLTTGVLVLDLSKVESSPAQFTVELRAPRGLPRPPRLIRVEPNALPVTQKRQNVEQLGYLTDGGITGRPDQLIDLKSSNLCFDSGQTPLRIVFADDQEWTRCSDLSQQGPDDQVYAFDDQRARVMFGNGINGRIPSQSATFTYELSEGIAGNVARNRKWSVAGIAGTFGVNVEPLAGGAPAQSLIDLRRQARERRHDHALVSGQDIIDAALALPLLEVARAWIPSFPTAATQTGTITLVVMRARPGGIEPADPPETSRWLSAVRASLAPRLPLGTRLRVIGPEYVDFTLRAQVQTARGRDRTVILNKVMEVLQKRLALTQVNADVTPRALGEPLSARDATAWIRTVDGVTAVTQLKFTTAGGNVANISMSAIGLPRTDPLASQFTAPAGSGASK